MQQSSIIWNRERRRTVDVETRTGVRQQMHLLKTNFDWWNWVEAEREAGRRRVFVTDAKRSLINR